MKLYFIPACSLHHPTGPLKTGPRNDHEDVGFGHRNNKQLVQRISLKGFRFFGLSKQDLEIIQAFRPSHWKGMTIMRDEITWELALRIRQQDSQ